MPAGRGIGMMPPGALNGKPDRRRFTQFDVRPPRRFWFRAPHARTPTRLPTSRFSSRHARPRIPTWPSTWLWRASSPWVREPIRSHFRSHFDFISVVSSPLLNRLPASSRLMCTLCGKNSVCQYFQIHNCNPKLGTALDYVQPKA